VTQGTQQRGPPIGIVRLNQAHNLIVDDPTIRTVAVPVDAAQIDIQTGLRQGQSQHVQQTLPIDGLTRPACRTLLGQPHQKTGINQGHASATAVLAKAPFCSAILRKIIAFHYLSISVKNNVAKVRNGLILRLGLGAIGAP
jgi:hypothetical protein